MLNYTLYMQVEVSPNEEIRNNSFSYSFTGYKTLVNQVTWAHTTLLPCWMDSLGLMDINVYSHYPVKTILFRIIFIIYHTLNTLP